jgi:hypothetical protein
VGGPGGLGGPIRTPTAREGVAKSIEVFRLCNAKSKGAFWPLQCKVEKVTGEKAGFGGSGSAI